MSEERMNRAQFGAGKETIDGVLEIDKLFGGVTPQKVLADVVGIENRAVLESTFLAAVSSCRGVRQNVETVSRLGGQPAAAFQLAGKPNMTALVMLGHMIYMIPRQYFTEKFKGSYQNYVSTLGGAANIKAFSSSGDIKGKESRTKILREYASRMNVTPDELKQLRIYLTSKTTGVFRTAPGPAAQGARTAVGPQATDVLGPTAPVTARAAQAATRAAPVAAAAGRSSAPDAGITVTPAVDTTAQIARAITPVDPNAGTGAPSAEPLTGGALVAAAVDEHTAMEVDAFPGERALTEEESRRALNVQFGIESIQVAPIAQDGGLAYDDWGAGYAGVLPPMDDNQAYEQPPGSDVAMGGAEDEDGSYVEEIEGEVEEHDEGGISGDEVAPVEEDWADEEEGVYEVEEEDVSVPPVQAARGAPVPRGDASESAELAAALALSSRMAVVEPHETLVNFASPTFVQPPPPPGRPAAQPQQRQQQPAVSPPPHLAQIRTHSGLAALGDGRKVAPAQQGSVLGVHSRGASASSTPSASQAAKKNTSSQAPRT